MYYNTHFLREDTAFITIRLSDGELQSLRQYMHCEPYHWFVGFPNGIRLLPRGFGWFRMETSNAVRAIDKLKNALGIFLRWHKTQNLIGNQVLKMRELHGSGKSVVAYVDAGSANGKVVSITKGKPDTPHNAKPTQTAKPATRPDLERLLAAYSVRHAYA